jgi:hypothetical protein
MKTSSSVDSIRAFSTKDWERQQLTLAIVAEIKSFSENCGGHVNLASEAAQQHLAEAITSVVERAVLQ